MKKMLAVCFAMGLAACSAKEADEEYICVITQNGKELLVSGHSQKWMCEAHGKKMSSQLQMETNKKSEKPGETVFAYQCVKESEFK